MSEFAGTSERYVGVQRSYETGGDDPLECFH